MGRTKCEKWLNTSRYWYIDTRVGEYIIGPFFVLVVYNKSRKSQQLLCYIVTYMMWVLAILLIPLALVLYLLLAPIVLEVDTDADLYQVRYHKLASAQLTLDEFEPVVHIDVLKWHRSFPLIKKTEKVIVTEEAQKAPSTEEKTRQGSMRIGKVLLNMANSFKVRHWYVTFDTGDMVLNGQLYPWVYLAGRHLDKPTVINFWGQNLVQLSISNNLGRMGWVYFKHQLKR